MLPGILQHFNFQISKFRKVDIVVEMFDILQYLPFPSGVVALRGIQNQGFDFFEVENQGYNALDVWVFFENLLNMLTNNCHVYRL